MLWYRRGLRRVHEGNAIHVCIEHWRTPQQHDEKPPIAWKHAMAAPILETPPA
jgi:hypothetical protein